MSWMKHQNRQDSSKVTMAVGYKYEREKYVVYCCVPRMSKLFYLINFK